MTRWRCIITINTEFVVNQTSYYNIYKFNREVEVLEMFPVINNIFKCCPKSKTDK